MQNPKNTDSGGLSSVGVGFKREESAAEKPPD